jgi:hypothetical protein
MVHAEPGAGATEARHHLVRDQERAVMEIAQGGLDMGRPMLAPPGALRPRPPARSAAPPPAARQSPCRDRQTCRRCTRAAALGRRRAAAAGGAAARRGSRSCWAGSAARSCRRRRGACEMSRNSISIAALSKHKGRDELACCDALRAPDAQA